MASSTNPYASFLGQSEPETIIAETPEKLNQFVAALGSNGLSKSYEPGKWTARQIICHLADTEIAFAFRLRQALAEPRHTIQPFDQEKWADSYSDESLNAQTAAHVFSTVRNWNLCLLKTLPPEARAKAVVHPERGEMTFQTIVETMGGHDLNHLSQLQKIAGQV